jgi:hypothetical protein
MIWFGSKPKVQADEKSAAIGYDDFEVRLGDLMRGERATLGKSLLDVQRELHIRATYVAAIEAGDLSAFEAQSFVAGYVRSYARYLGMDADWCFQKFCAETGFALSSDLHRALAPTKVDVPVSRDFNTGMLGRTQMGASSEPVWSRLNLHAIGSVSVLVGLVTVLGYGGWTVLQEVQRVNLVPADQPPAVLADLDPVMSGAVPRMGDGDGPAMRLGNVAQVGALEPDLQGAVGAALDAQGVVRVYRPEALDAPVMVARDGPIAAINPRASDPAPVIDTSDAVMAALSGDVRVTTDGPPVVEVLAVRPSWVRVRSADGTVLFEKVLDAGERYTVPAAEEAPILRAGNSGSVYMLVNGQPFGPMAPGAQVVDQIQLSADAVTERFTVADLSGDGDLRKIVEVAQAE